jgi:3-deoxy-D-manno-octulosonic-acid transferase
LLTQVSWRELDYEMIVSSLYPLFYQVLIRIAAVSVFIATALRSVRDPSYRDRLAERFGFTRLQFVRPPIWVHAASVGEVQAAAPLIRRLVGNAEKYPVLVTTTTPTGAARVKALFADPSFAHQVQHAYLPYDTRGAVRRFLRRIAPHCLIIMETELWPNLLSACVATNVPVVLGSARISSRTASRYRHLHALFAKSLAQVSVGAQTVEDAQRYTLLGALPERTQVTGNIKFDIEISESVLSDGTQLRQGLASRPVWVAGSTHEGEEALVLAAQRVVLTYYADALLILAPRHPQRFAQVAALLTAQNIAFATRSADPVPQAHQTVWLLDTLGELTRFYAASDVVFVGGSLVPVGGHNLLEPASLALPVLTGPQTFNAPDVAELLAEHRALRYVYSGQELGEVVAELLAAPSERARMGAAAITVVQQSTGALGRLLTLIQQQCHITLR